MHLSFLCVLNELIESQGSREAEHVHGSSLTGLKILPKIIYSRIPFLGHISTRATALYLQRLFENSLSTPLTHNFSLISPSACFSKYREVQLL